MSQQEISVINLDQLVSMTSVEIAAYYREGDR